MGNYKVTRTFHPVGQGGFYTECHNDEFNIVYDCGSTPRKHSSSIVQSTFSKRDDIDILFISHFDYDHVSSIATLKKNTGTIHAVVMPLLEPEHQALLINLNRVLSDSILKLISKPESFFDSNTVIYKVRPSNTQEAEDNDNPIEIMRSPPETMPDGSRYFFQRAPEPILINSGRLIKLESSNREKNSRQFWTFTPYNYQNTTRCLNLIQELKKSGFDTELLKSDSGYTINEIATPAKRRALRKVYNSLNGTVNENSMLVYSGPLNSEYQLVPCNCSGAECNSNCNLKPGCIYTGDCDFNKITLNQAFERHINKVGVVQIPHHGSKDSFDINSLDSVNSSQSLICPVSYGTTNRYKHPSRDVINSLILSPKKYRPINITEDPNTVFTQKIDLIL